MTWKHASFAVAFVFAVGITAMGASAQTVSGNEGSGETPRSLEELPDLTRRNVVNLMPKLDEGGQRSMKEPTEEELQKGFTTIVRSRDGSQKTIAPNEALRNTIIRRLKGEKQTRAAPSTGADPLFEVTERTVIGEDNRVRISETTNYPFRTFGQLWADKGNDDWGVCSATLISSRAVLTAAHCVYDHEAGGWLNDYEFYPAMNGKGRAPYGRYSWEDVYIPSGFIENWQGYYGSVVPWDIAVIVLDQPAGSHLGWMGYSVYDPAYAFTANIVGYPGDKPDGTMWRASCDVDPALADDTNMEYICDTWPGSSGSSVYDYNPDTKERTINGVNIASRPEINVGIRMTWTYFDWVQQHAN